MPSNLPSFFIIGAMKSATSTLHNQLAAQKGIYMSTPKEPNFFSDDAVYAQGIDWYQSLFSGAAAGDICGESSTHYTKLPDYPKTINRLKPLVPSPNLIYVMRHPIDRLVSHYIHQWSEGLICCDINQAIDRFPELIHYSSYGRQIKPYLDAFGAEAVLPVFFESLKSQPDKTLQQVGRFIGCQNQLNWVHDLSLDNVSKQRIRKFRGYHWLVESSVMTKLRRSVVPQRLRDSVKSRLRMDQRPEINNVQRQNLKSFFDDDLSVLTDWLGFKLTCDHFSTLDE